MKAFQQNEGTVALLDRANVDTDQIIPKQFLKSIRRTGFGDNLFDAWRYLDEGEIGKNANERRINHDFILNEPRYAGASILLARENFGCGSSREHAVWALLEYGFRCVIAPSFADIFFNNSLKNGLLPVVLAKEDVDQLFGIVHREVGYTLRVDLGTQTVKGSGFAAHFDIEPEPKRLLMDGLDDIGATLAHADAIREFESRHRQRMPWVFARDGNTA
ncbi:MAG: 3-isopropylmalate dehydratase small subunit [Gammaproteobacteria bacterium]|nr:3-isopropylmalate dehydratase small subunit [Gammaproteobacteria bacterium]MYF27594.1 3-isopropylmalate dehydratase small subunit [Gammaproteobacteria bacterium]MYK48133.1 3-isopropylmalate dehydratase small subunit [Gammaproteobacteria bacterium]